MKIKLPTLEVILVVTIVFLFLDTIFIRSTVLSTETAHALPSAGGSLLHAARSGFAAALYFIWILLLGATMVRDFPRLLRLAARSKGLIALLALVMISAFWSIDLPLTLSRGTQLVVSAGLGYYLAARYPIEDVLGFVGLALVVVMGLSLLAVLVAPGTGLEQGMKHYGNWRGIFPQKNRLGITMALATLLFLVQARGDPRWRYAGSVLAAIAGLMVIMSASATGLILVLVGLGSSVMFRGLRWHVSLLIPLSFVLLGGLGVLATAAPVGLEQVALALGRDPTLTGRSVLWAVLAERLLNRPLLGYGFGAFWTARESGAQPVWTAVGWEAPSAHNGFLDLWLSVGAIGTLLFAAVFLLTFWRAFRYAHDRGDVYGRWPVLFLTFFAMLNLVTSSLLKQNNIFWALFVYTALVVVKRAPRSSTEATEHVRVPTPQYP